MFYKLFLFIIITNFCSAGEYIHVQIPIIDGVLFLALLLPKMSVLIKAESTHTEGQYHEWIYQLINFQKKKSWTSHQNYLRPQLVEKINFNKIDLSHTNSYSLMLKLVSNILVFGSHFIKYKKLHHVFLELFILSHKF